MNLPTDRFCRAAVHPNCTKSDRFDAAALLAFSDGENYMRALSLAGWDKCANPESVHEFGTNVASEKNNRKAQQYEGELPEDKMHYYLGYYEFLARYVSFAELMYTNGILRHAPEDGDDRHFQIDLLPTEATISSKRPAKLVKSDERIIRSLLSDILSGPQLLPADQCSERQSLLQKEFMPALGGGDAPDNAH